MSTAAAARARKPGWAVWLSPALACGGWTALQGGHACHSPPRGLPRAGVGRAAEWWTCMSPQPSLRSCAQGSSRTRGTRSSATSGVRPCRDLETGRLPRVAARPRHRPSRPRSSAPSPTRAPTPWTSPASRAALNEPLSVLRCRNRPNTTTTAAPRSSTAPAGPAVRHVPRRPLRALAPPQRGCSRQGTAAREQLASLAETSAPPSASTTTSSPS